MFEGPGGELAASRRRLRERALRTQRAPLSVTFSLAGAGVAGPTPTAAASLGRTASGRAAANTGKHPVDRAVPWATVV